MPYACLLLLTLLLGGAPAGAVPAGAVPAAAAPARAATGVAAAVRWVAPLDPLVVRDGFSPPARRWGAGHRGVDLLGSVGDAVRSAGAGEVAFAGVLAGRGVVVVRHGTLRTTYEPVSALMPVGTHVGVGAVIGTLDPGGHGGVPPPNAVLHWGLLRGETYLDPLLLLRRSPARLVPVAPAPPPDAPGRSPARASPPIGVPAPADRHDRGGVPPAVPLAAAGTLTALAVSGGMLRRRSRGP